jgi:hypothetical protein
MTVIFIKTITLFREVIFMDNWPKIELLCHDCGTGKKIFDLYVECVGSVVFYKISGDAICPVCGCRELMDGSMNAARILKEGKPTV